MSQHNSNPDAIKKDAQELAHLLEVGMVDFFVDKFKSLLNKPGNNAGQLADVINELLSRDKERLPRLEMSDSMGDLPARVDVVTKGRFIGPGWPIRHSIIIDNR